MAQLSVPLSYGADSSGLICAYAFVPGQAPQLLDSTQAWLWLQQPHPAAEFIWLHVNLSQANSLIWLQQQLDLPEEFYETLHEQATSTRIERVDETLLAIINDVLFDFNFEDSDIATLWLAARPQLLITARLRPLRSVDRLRMAVKEGELFESPLALLVHLFQDQADVLTQIVRQMASRCDDIEDRLLANRGTPRRAALGTMRRLLVRLQRLLAPEPAALFRLLNRPPHWVQEHDRQELRQSTEEFASVIQDMHSLQERIKLLQEEIAAQVNEQNNRSLFVLTTVSVLALPINIIAGLLGMNVGGIPLAQSPHGFLVIVMIVASFTVIAGYWAFGRNRADEP